MIFLPAGIMMAAVGILFAFLLWGTVLAFAVVIWLSISLAAMCIGALAINRKRNRRRDFSGGIRNLLGTARGDPHGCR